MAPLGALSQAWVSAEASLPRGWEIAGVGGALALRGWWRLVALIAGLLVPWYFFVVPDIRI